MSALWNPVLATTTLFAATLTVPIAVPVNKDLPEMEQCVKVCKRLLPYVTLIPFRNTTCS